MVSQDLRQLQETLNRKADMIQREFIAAGDKLHSLGRKITEAHGDEQKTLLAEQEAVHQHRLALADEINIWRDRARNALHPLGEAQLRAYLNELVATEDEAVRAGAEHVLLLMNATEEELAHMAAQQERSRPTTPVGRLVERARTEFDLRGQEPSFRQRAAVEFANRPGLSQNDDALAELEAAVDDPDPLVQEVVLLTLIQVHRFRAVRLADLDIALASTERLTQINHPAAIPALIEIAQAHRPGFTHAPNNDVVESTNRPLREAAIKRLVTWNTPQALAAVNARRQDRDSYIVEVANRALASVSSSP
jgi:hypothetical protein